MRPSHVEVDLQAIHDNVAAIAAAVSPAMLCAVVKADGYGHGDVPAADFIPIARRVTAWREGEDFTADDFARIVETSLDEDSDAGAWMLGLARFTAPAWLDGFLRAVTHAGGARATTGLSLVLLLLPETRGLGLLTALANLLSHLAVQALKRTVVRPRPHLLRRSWPEHRW